MLAFLVKCDSIWAATFVTFISHHSATYGQKSQHAITTSNLATDLTIKTGALHGNHTAQVVCVTSRQVHCNA